MKKAIFLMSMGGPDCLANVRLFLYRLFADSAIIRLPAWMRIPLALLISFLRAPGSRRNYTKIGGASPILENTEKQAIALEKILNKQGEEDHYRCFVGMSYMDPFIKDVVEKIKAFKADETILVPLYPQYSTTTTASTLKESKKFLNYPCKEVDCFYKNSGFIKAIVDNIEKKWSAAEKHGVPILLFSAHGLPQQIVDQGDPYPEQCEETVQAIIKELPFLCDITLCYQSHLGPQKWIKPYLEEELINAGNLGRPVLVVPISFVCEHVETLVELQKDYRQRAKDMGVPFYDVVSTVGTHPVFIKGLATILTKI